VTCETNHDVAVNAPQIRLIGDTLSVHFDRFDRAAYELFLRVKRLAGVPHRLHRRRDVHLDRHRPGPLRYLFDDQRAIVAQALAAKRFACWMDTGLGKTAVFLEWARQVTHKTGGRVLIVTLANLVEQTLEMARQFYPGDALPIVRIKSKAHLRAWCAGKGNR
jgi:hypothetical protein